MRGLSLQQYCLARANLRPNDSRYQSPVEASSKHKMERAVGDLVTHWEGIVGDPGDGSTMNLVAVCTELSLQLIELRTSYNQLLEVHEGLIRDLKHRNLQQQRLDLAMKERLELRIHTLEEELIRQRQEAQNPINMIGAPAKEAKVREPKAFGGVRSATKVENFIWDMEVYFHAAKILAADQVDRASAYLEGNAKLWWRTRTAEDDRAEHPRIEALDIFKRELKGQFLPSNASWVAQENLQKLR